MRPLVNTLSRLENTLHGTAVKETRFRESKLCNEHAELAHWNLWAFTLPLWAYVLVGFCPMGFCPMGFCPMGFCPNTHSNKVH